MTNKQKAEAITMFLSEKLKQSAKNFHKGEDDDTKEHDLVRVIIIRDLLKELNDGKK